MRGSAGQLRVARQFFETLILALPEPAERSALGEKLQKIDDSLRKMGQHVQQTQDLRKALLSNMLRE